MDKIGQEKIEMKLEVEKGKMSRALIISGILLLSLAARIYNIGAPIVEWYGPRQAHTAITVQTWIREGLDIIHYQVPILGEPWRIPYEFPIYQVSAYMIYQILSGLNITQNLDIAMRLTTIIWFYISAIYFYRFLREIFENDGRSTLMIEYSLICYLFLPYSILVSRVALIDMCATSLGLIYMFYLYQLMIEKDRNRSLVTMIITIFVGILSYLAKPTSMFPVAFFTAFVGIRYLYFSGKLYPLKWFIRENIFYYLRLLLAVFLPLIPCLIWTKHSDMVKTNLGLVNLTSTSLHDWNFGTWEQKANVENWGVILNRFNMVFPVIILLIFFSVTLYIKAGQKRENFIQLAAFYSILGTIFSLFNLYWRHTYYFIAILPFLCIFLGIMVFQIVEHIHLIIRNNRVRICLGGYCPLFYSDCMVFLR